MPHLKNNLLKYAIPNSPPRYLVHTGSKLATTEGCPFFAHDEAKSALIPSWCGWTISGAFQITSSVVATVIRNISKHQKYMANADNTKKRNV